MGFFFAHQLGITYLRVEIDVEIVVYFVKKSLSTL